MTKYATFEIFGVEWSVELSGIESFNEAFVLRRTLMSPYLVPTEELRGVQEPEAQPLMAMGMEDRCPPNEARELMRSRKRFIHFATEATRVDRDEASRNRYGRAADRELAVFIGLPCTRIAGCYNEDDLGFLNQPGLGEAL